MFYILIEELVHSGESEVLILVEDLCVCVRLLLGCDVKTHQVEMTAN